ncbi:MAG TPA: PIN domain-containing protein [Balneolaceae bacterium]|nr:PIN domain-containing protein [Balneolaceae bacterium]
MDKILIDSDVCLDSFTGRYPFNVEADKLLLMVEDSLVQGIVSAESFSNMHYVLRKFSSSQTSFELLNQLKMIVSIGIVDSEVVTQALQSG